MLGQDVVAAQDPIGEQNVVRFVVPGVVGEIALGDEPDIAVAFGENPIGSGSADARAEKTGHGFSDLDDVVGVDVVEEGGADHLGGGKTEDQHGVFVHVDDSPLPAHSHLELKVDVVGADGEVDESQIRGQFPQQQNARL